MSQTRLFSDSKARKLQKLYLSGKSAQDLASMRGCSKATIVNTLKRVGTKMRSGSDCLYIINDSEARVFRKKYERGDTVEEISKGRYSRPAVYNAIKRVGGKLRPASPLLFSNDAALCLRKKYECGWSGPELARIKNCSTAVVYRAIKRVGGRTRFAQGFSDAPEYKTIQSHYDGIRKPYGRHRCYKNMPFFDGWNPRKGGSWYAGFQWILKNLGRRPKGTSLHIINHAKGFVPGNLEWTHPQKQSNQQMFKIIAQQQHEIKKLKRAIHSLKATP